MSKFAPHSSVGWTVEAGCRNEHSRSEWRDAHATGVACNPVLSFVAGLSVEGCFVTLVGCFRLLNAIAVQSRTGFRVPLRGPGMTDFFPFLVSRFPVSVSGFPPSHPNAANTGATCAPRPIAWLTWMSRSLSCAGESAHIVACPTLRPARAVFP